MKGDTFGGDEQHLHEEKKHPGGFQNSVHMQDWRGEIGLVEAGKIVGRREASKGRKKQGNDDCREEIAIVAPSGRQPGWDREGRSDCRHMRSKTWRWGREQMVSRRSRIQVFGQRHTELQARLNG